MSDFMEKQIPDDLKEDLDFSTWKDWYLFVQFLFYFSQGAAFAAILLIAPFLQTLGYLEDEALTIQSIIFIPWLIKIVFGILSDTVKVGKFGRRKPYILIAGLIGIIGWISLPMYTSPHWSIILIGMFVTGSVALGDTVLDSLGVDVTPPNRRGWMQGVAWGARGGGAILSGVFLGVWGNQLGWRYSYLIIGIFAVVGIMSALLIKEADNIPKVYLADFGREFRKGVTWHVTLFDFISGMGIALVSVMVTFMSEVLDLDIETAGVGTIGWGLVFFSVGQLIGALSIGGLGQKLNLLWVFVINAIVYTGFILSFLWIDFEALGAPELSFPTVLYLLVLLLGAINGGYETSQMRISMEYSAKVSRGSLTGTMYNWYNSMSNLGQLSIGTLIIAQLIGAGIRYPVAMQLSAIALVLSLIPGILLIKKLKLDRKQ
ncbi:MAG: MFS transporter [Candidatus Lokiarchaeota archaeon]|nr:MFS transporter [Candidatus Lokiarchaeota archaeon]